MKNCYATKCVHFFKIAFFFLPFSLERVKINARAMAFKHRPQQQTQLYQLEIMPEAPAIPLRIVQKRLQICRWKLKVCKTLLSVCLTMEKLFIVC
jgi:hypothetical protein